MRDQTTMEEFRKKFFQLKEMCSDNPASLPNLAKDDDSIRDLCSKLNGLSFGMLHSDTSHIGKKIVSNVDSRHLDVWCDFSQNYRSVLFHICCPELSDLEFSTTDFGLASTSEIKSAWDEADDIARERANEIRALTDLAGLPEQNLGVEDPEAKQLKEGANQLEQVFALISDDIIGVFRRTLLIEVLYLDHRKSSLLGSKSNRKVTALRNLDHAHRAFIFGAPNAALALLRAVLEMVLTKLFDVKKEYLREMIEELEKKRRLPDGIGLPALRNIKDFADGALHDNAKKLERFQGMELVMEEMYFAQSFSVIRRLIEVAK